ncbi:MULTISPECIES: nuclear transport factor 2 family protein [Flavobacteriaceae]|uniref:nuclear transport factor 2 family protein n=1 Tax=Flavobacteriaceae TaxID=49546 RepID=UPI0014909EB6|nr:MULTISPECIES: nuclear transport factor 2 family protein [Allomuricauda]MDC6366358.1 nuclear transport factor 2 family protein [Muricauda sp. AC10]
MKTKFSLLAFFFTLCSFAQTEEKAITETLNNYINGSSYNDPELIQSAFYEEADLYLSKKDQEIWVLSPKEYGDLFSNRKKGKFNGRVGKVLAIDYENNIASAKAEIVIASQKMTYIDIFLLKKISGKWKIISKAATLKTDEN